MLAFLPAFLVKRHCSHLYKSKLYAEKCRLIVFNDRIAWHWKNKALTT